MRRGEGREEEGGGGDARFSTADSSGAGSSSSERVGPRSSPLLRTHKTSEENPNCDFFSITVFNHHLYSRLWKQSPHRTITGLPRFCVNDPCSSFSPLKRTEPAPPAEPAPPTEPAPPGKSAAVRGEVEEEAEVASAPPSVRTKASKKLLDFFFSYLSCLFFGFCCVIFWISICWNIKKQ